MIGNLFYEYVGNIGYWYIALGRGGHIYRVRAHAAKCYDFAVFQAINNVFGKAASPGDDSVGIS